MTRGDVLDNVFASLSATTRRDTVLKNMKNPNTKPPTSTLSTVMVKLKVTAKLAVTVRLKVTVKPRAMARLTTVTRSPTAPTRPRSSVTKLPGPSQLWIATISMKRYENKVL